MKSKVLVLGLLLGAMTLGIASCGEKVKPQEVTSVTVDPTSVTLKAGETKQLTVTLAPQGVKATTQFTSSDEKVATVNDKGLVKAVADGTATITVKAGNKSATCTVTVGEVAKVSEVKVEPATVELEVGATQELKVTWTPQEVKATPTFTSDKEDVATVSDKGVITAVAGGEATIKVAIGEVSATCAVKVKKQASKNEMPLLTYQMPDNEEVMAYEKALGRVLKENVVFQRTAKGDFATQGYVNDSFDIFPAVAYGITYGEGSQAKLILALGKEDFDNCEKTLNLLRANGYSDAKVLTLQDGTKTIIGHHDTDYTQSVSGQKMIIEKSDLQPETKILYIFTKNPDLEPKTHPVKTDAKDFPSWTDFITKDVEKIKAFETKLGLRKYFPKQSNEAKKNLFFAVNKEKTAETNLDVVFYCATPKGGPIFINCVLNCIDNTGQLNSDEVKVWLKTNGFGTDFKETSRDWVKAFNEDKSLGVQLFITDDNTTVLMQIVEGRFLKTMSQAKQMRNAAMFAIQEPTTLRLKAMR